MAPQTAVERAVVLFDAEDLGDKTHWAIKSTVLPEAWFVYSERNMIGVRMPPFWTPSRRQAWLVDGKIVVGRLVNVTNAKTIARVTADLDTGEIVSA